MLALEASRHALVLELGRTAFDGASPALLRDDRVRRFAPPHPTGRSFPMIRRRPLLLAGLALPAIATAQAAPLPLGFTTAKSGNWVSLTRRNEIAVNLAVEEVNAAGGIHGRPIAIRSFDTASRPEQAAIATRQFAEDDGALAVIGPFSSSECRVAFPVGDRLGIAQMAIASSAPGLAAPFRFAFRNTSDEAYLFERLLSVVRGGHRSE
eukprot:gene49077-60075_t